MMRVIIENMRFFDKKVMNYMTNNRKNNILHSKQLFHKFHGQHFLVTKNLNGQRFSTF